MGAAASRRRIVKTAHTRVDFTPPFGDPVPENPIIYFDISLSQEPCATYLGRIIVELKRDLFPGRTASLLAYIEQSAGVLPLPIDMILPNFLCQVDLNSLQIAPEFENQNANLSHHDAGVVSLNLSYLYPRLVFTTAPNPWFDETQAILGQVIRGFEVLKATELCGNSSGDLLFEVGIIEFGQLQEIPPVEDPTDGQGNAGQAAKTIRNIHWNFLKPILLTFSVALLICLLIKPVRSAKGIWKFLKDFVTFGVKSKFKIRAHLSFD